MPLCIEHEAYEADNMSVTISYIQLYWLNLQLNYDGGIGIWKCLFSYARFVPTKSHATHDAVHIEAHDHFPHRENLFEPDKVHELRTYLSSCISSGNQLKV